MQEQLIKFETADLAYQKGFDNIECIHYYFDKELECNYEEPLSLSTLITIRLAPTQSILQKWIRENHNMNIHIEVLNKRYYFQIKQIDPRIDKGMDLAVGPFDKYEQALEEALQQALKLI